MNEEEENIVTELGNRGYNQDPKKDNSDEGGYGYLLRMQVRTFTANKVRQIKKDIISAQEKLDGLRALTETDMWLRDLDDFEKGYTKWLKDIAKQIIKARKKKQKKK